MSTVLLTGASGYLGSRVADALLTSGSVERVVGLDVRGLDAPREGLELHLRDVRQPFPDLLEGVDCAVHLAWVLDPSRDPARETAVNLGGTLRFLEACARAGTGHVVGISSTTAYGAWPDNPVPIGEDQLVRPDQPFQYAREKAQMEGLFRQFHEFHPEVGLALLRPCIIVGPGSDNFITRSIERPVNFLVGDRDPPWQFLHEDDLVRAVAGVVLRRLTGTFNVAPEGTLTGPELARMFGRRMVRLPARVVRPILAGGWKLRVGAISQAPAEILPFLAWPWVADGRRLREALGIAYEHDSSSAIRAFGRARGMEPRAA